MLAGSRIASSMATASSAGAAGAAGEGFEIQGRDASCPRPLPWPLLALPWPLSGGSVWLFLKRIKLAVDACCRPPVAQSPASSTALSWPFSTFWPPISTAVPRLALPSITLQHHHEHTYPPPAVLPTRESLQRALHCARRWPRTLEPPPPACHAHLPWPGTPLTHSKHPHLPRPAISRPLSRLSRHITSPPSESGCLRLLLAFTHAASRVLHPSGLSDEPASSRTSWERKDWLRPPLRPASVPITPTTPTTLSAFHHMRH